MKRSSAILLQTVIVVVGIAVLGFLLWEPQIEGRNAHATFFQIYFEDPFVPCAYLASIPFFVALYEAFTLLGDAGRSGAFSPRSLSALRTIRNCALILIGFIALGEAYLVIAVKGTDDIAGGVAMGVLVALISAAMATAASLFGRRLERHVLT